MSREDIERMAREAKGHPYTNRYTPGETAFAFSIDRLERFVAMVISQHDKANRPKPDATLREWLQQIAYQHGGIGDLSQTEFEFGAMVAAAIRGKV